MDIADRLLRLGKLLVQYQSLWQPRAFHYLQLPWETDYPALAVFLRQLSYEEAVDLQMSDVSLLAALQPYLPVVKDIQSLVMLNQADTALTFHYPPALLNEIPGRKLQQIDAFLNSANFSGAHLTDWCCGKGYLARVAAFRTGKQVCGLEWNAALVADGNAQVRQLQLPVSLHAVDVMSNTVDDLLHADSQLLALHACGDLHRRLLNKVVAHRCQSVHLSPCCYHLMADEFYQPFSRLVCDAVAAADAPLLTRDNLRTAVQQTVTAPAYVRRQRETLQAWRLGFDLLQRHLGYSDNYLPLPTLPASWSKGAFADFCQHVAALKTIALPDAIDFSLWEARGWQRFAEVTKLDLARQAFRRAMEVWLVLDRAQYLKEQGYRVEVLQFCHQQLTPRNILLMASVADE